MTDKKLSPCSQSCRDNPIHPSLRVARRRATSYHELPRMTSYRGTPCPLSTTRNINRIFPATGVIFLAITRVLHFVQALERLDEGRITHEKKMSFDKKRYSQLVPVIRYPGGVEGDSRKNSIVHSLLFASISEFSKIIETKKFNVAASYHEDLWSTFVHLINLGMVNNINNTTKATISNKP